MLHDTERNVDEKNVKKLQQLFVDAEKPLYNECKKFAKLSLVVKLLDLKAKNNWSDKSFTTLLELLHEAFPEDNELPVSTYQAKKLTCPMGLEVQRIHACPNDCILYRKDYKDLHKCPVYIESRYKHKNLTELDSDVTKNGPLAKLLWYLPIIPRLKKLYANPKDAKLLCWHAKERKNDGKIRYLAGLVFLRYMYPFKRYMWFLKGYVRNRYRPEGSIVQGYAAEEVVHFCTNYMDDVVDIGLPQPRHQGRLDRVGTIRRKDVTPTNDDFEQLGYRLRRVLQYQGYDINRYTFYTKQQDDKSTVQNSEVTLIATTTDSSRMTIAKYLYYGVVEDIWELDYTSFVIPLLKCKWVNNTRGVKVDSDGFTCVNLSTNGYLSDPFILAKQATQVFYVEDPKYKRWHIVLQSKQSIVGIDDVVDEDEYNKFDELPPFSIGSSQTKNKKRINRIQDLLLGTRTGRKIPILKKNWKQVTKEEKNFLLFDIKAHFRLENDDVKKRTLLSCGTKWKAFKTKLRVKFMLMKVSPLQKWTFIEPNVWEEFYQNENTPAKNKLRVQASERGKKHISRPRLGPKGYRSFEQQWQEERNDPDKATELHLIPDICESNYCLARAPRDQNGIKTLPPELIDVSKNLAKLRNEMQAEQNLFSPREDDVSNSVHMKSSLNSTTIMVRNETQAQQNESFSPRQEGNHSSVQIRSNLSSTKSIRRKEQQGEQNESILTRQVDVLSWVHRRSNLSSNTSIVKLHCIKEETYCCLYIPSSVLAREKVVWATAIVYPIEDGILHFKKLLKGHMKVSVIKVVKIHKSMELPVLDDEIPNLESTVKGFIQWKIAFIARFTGMSKTPVSGVLTKHVMHQHENAPSTKKGKGNEPLKEPNKQDKALEETTKHQKIMQKIDEVKEQVEKEKAANRKSLQALEDEVLLNRPHNVKDGYIKWMSHGDCVDPYAIIVNKKMAYYNMMHRHSDPYDWANPSRQKQYSFIDKIPFDEAPRMSDRLIYQDNMVTESHRVHNRREPEHPRDDDPESRNDEMFSITEPTLVELYEVMCKPEDDLWIIARDKKNKRRAEDKKNECWEEGTPSCNDCSMTSSSKNDEPEASLSAWIFL
nr:hypothetical protein [Tanacetum cinerariifolium]